ncbi:LysE family translocator [Roseovarius sp. Pro17]|uniref:LysE family translocator n=1 Tax=Roseovarius sp. Pro17 TaxID=3108175 RepID=UPI002D78EAF2|nr:LysE family translocator [Roseovarius sp. Pro17]
MLSIFLPLLVFLFPLAFSPGPGNMFFAASGARFGLRATLPANLGYHVATFLVTLAIGLGFAEGASLFPGLFGALKLAGSAYVLWLAWTLLCAGAQGGVAEARSIRFRDGAVLLLLNPKAYVIITLMFSQFLTTKGGSDFWVVIVIVATFTLNNLVSFLVWTMFGDILARRFREDRSARHINLAFGSLLAAVGLWMMFS